MLGRCDAQTVEMQGAAERRYSKQTTPQRVGDAERRSRSTVSASSVQHYMFRTTQELVLLKQRREEIKNS